MAQTRQSREHLTASEVRSNPVAQAFPQPALGGIAKVAERPSAGFQMEDDARGPLWRGEGEELPHGRRGDGCSRKILHAEALQSQSKHTWMLVQRRGLKRYLGGSGRSEERRVGKECVTTC